MTFMYSQSFLHGFIWNQHNDQLPVACQVTGSNPVQAWIFFFSLIFTTAQVVFIPTKISFIFTYFTLNAGFILCQSLDSKTLIEATNGQSVKAKTVFAWSIMFLKDEAIKVIFRRTEDDHFSQDDVQWALTVLAIWTPSAKQLIR